MRDVARAAVTVAAVAGLVVMGAAVAVLARYAGPAIGESIVDMRAERRARTLPPGGI